MRPPRYKWISTRVSLSSARRLARSSLLALSLILAVPPSWAACTVGAIGVIFGSYDIFDNVALDSAGRVDVTCDVGTVSYNIALSPGSGSYATRTMTGAGSLLNYNLFADPTRLIVWGDGTSGTSSVPGVGLGANHTVYARIPSRQNVPVGTYADTVVVTLTF
jgi:spore coat protein U-like protein